LRFLGGNKFGELSSGIEDGREDRVIARFFRYLYPLRPVTGYAIKATATGSIVEENGPTPEDSKMQRINIGSESLRSKSRI